MSKSDITYDEWRKALEEVRLESKRLVPEGWISATDFGAQMGFSTGNAGRSLKKLYDAQKIDRQKLNGMFYYKLKKK